MREEEVKRLLQDAGALVAGSHIVGASGRHMDNYINPDRLYENAEALSDIAAAMADLARGLDINAVVGPANGGNHLARAIAVCAEGSPRALLTEKDAGDSFRFVLWDGMVIYRKNVLVCEDILTTGRSAAEIVKISREAGALVLGVLGLWNRGAVGRDALALGTEDLFQCLVSEAIPSWTSEECPLCASGAPVDIRYGHGKEFLAAKGG